MSTDTYILLSVLLAVVVIVVLALALIRVRQGLTKISADLDTLASALLANGIVLVGRIDA